MPWAARQVSITLDLSLIKELGGHFGGNGCWTKVPTPVSLTSCVRRSWTGIYVGDVLRLKLLAPDIIKAIMDWRQPVERGVHVLREGFSVEWGE